MTTVSIPADALHYISYLMLLGLALLLAANNVALTVAPLHGTKVAQWRKSLSVVLCGFLLGALLLSALPAAHLPLMLKPMVEPRERLLFSLVTRLTWGLLSVISWTAVSLIVGATLFLPLPANFTITLSIILVVSITTSDSGPFTETLNQILSTLISEAIIVNGVFLVTSLVGTAGIYWLLSRPLEREDPLAGTLSLLSPLYTCLLSAYAALLTAALGRLYNLGYTLIVSLSLATGLTTALLTLLWVRLLMTNRIKRHVFERYPPHCLEYSGFGEERLAERGMVVGRESPTPTPSRESTLSGLNRQRAEESLAFLLLTATGLSALVQGAGDVGIIRGLASILGGLLTGQPLTLSGITSALPLLSIFCAAVGVITLTSRFTRRLAHDLATITPSMALAIELGCSIPGLSLLVVGYPISSFIGRWPALLLVTYLSKGGMQRRVAWLVSGGALGGVLLSLAVVGITSLLSYFLFISLQK